MCFFKPTGPSTSTSVYACIWCSDSMSPTSETKLQVFTFLHCPCIIFKGRLLPLDLWNSIETPTDRFGHPHPRHVKFHRCAWSDLSCACVAWLACATWLARNLTNQNKLPPEAVGKTVNFTHCTATSRCIWNGKGPKLWLCSWNDFPNFKQSIYRHQQQLSVKFVLFVCCVLLYHALQQGK